MKLLIWLIFLKYQSNDNLYDNFIENSKYPYKFKKEVKKFNTKNNFNSYTILKIIRQKFNNLNYILSLKLKKQSDKKNLVSVGLKNLENNFIIRTKMLILKKNIRKINSYVIKFNKYVKFMNSKINNIFKFYLTTYNKKIIKDFNFNFIDNNNILRNYDGIKKLVNIEYIKFSKLLKSIFLDFKILKNSLKEYFILKNKINNTVLVSNNIYENYKNNILLIKSKKIKLMVNINRIINVIENLLTYKLKVKKLYLKLEKHNNNTLLSFKKKLVKRNKILEYYKNKLEINKFNNSNIIFVILISLNVLFN